MELDQQIYEALTIAADTVCELKCPSVWKTGETQPHSEECKKVRAARSAWMDHCSYSDLIASGGLLHEDELGFHQVGVDGERVPVATVVGKER